MCRPLPARGLHICFHHRVQQVDPLPGSARGGQRLRGRCWVTGWCCGSETRPWRRVAWLVQGQPAPGVAVGMRSAMLLSPLRPAPRGGTRAPGQRMNCSTNTTRAAHRPRRHHLQAGQGPSATSGSSNAEARNAPWSPSATPSSPSAGTCSPTPPPTSPTSAPTGTTASPPSGANISSSPNSNDCQARKSPSTTPPDTRGKPPSPRAAPANNPAPLALRRVLPPAR